jgi:NAD(P)-dependent dehydrogenase (short-subunit alcohol dehydrogenase family)
MEVYMNTNKNLSGKTIIVTGATSGIGFEAAKKMASCQAFVIGVGRSQQKCEQAKERIRKVCSNAKVEFLVADLASLKQVRELAGVIEKVVRREGREHIDVLLNNAGTFSSWFISTAEGFELQFAVNHLAPFLLTHQLMPLLKAAPEGRVITVSSGSHYRTRINWKDIMMRRHYNCLMAYKQSKLANVLFSAELNRRLGYDSTVRALAVDPGLVNTDIGLKNTAGIARWIWLKRSKRGISPAEAAASIVYLAGEPSVHNSGHVYWKNCKPKRPSKYSEREDEALRLWELSEKLCGIATIQEKPALL